MEEILHLGNLVVYPLGAFFRVLYIPGGSPAVIILIIVMVHVITCHQHPESSTAPSSAVHSLKRGMQHSVGRKFLTTSSLLPRTILKGKGPSEPTITLQGIFVSFQGFPPKQRTTSQPHPTKTRPGKKNKMGPGCRSF